VSAPIPRPSPVTQPNKELVFVTPSHLREPRQRWDELPEWQPKPSPEIEKAKCKQPHGYPHPPEGREFTAGWLICFLDRFS